MSKNSHYNEFGKFFGIPNADKAPALPCSENPFVIGQTGVGMSRCFVSPSQMSNLAVGNNIMVTYPPCEFPEGRSLDGENGRNTEHGFYFGRAGSGMTFSIKRDIWNKQKEGLLK